MQLFGVREDTAWVYFMTLKGMLISVQETFMIAFKQIMMLYVLEHILISINTKLLTYMAGIESV